MSDNKVQNAAVNDIGQVSSQHMNMAGFEVPIPDATAGSSIVTAVVSILGAILWLRRRLSRDNLEVSKDSAEKNLLVTAIAERDKAIASAEEAWESRTKDAELIGKLSSDVEHLSAINKNLLEEVERLRAEINDLRILIKLKLKEL